MLEVVGALGVADDVLGAVGGMVALRVGVVALDVVGGLGVGVVTLGVADDVLGAARGVVALGVGVAALNVVDDVLGTSVLDGEICLLSISSVSVWRKNNFYSSCVAFAGCGLREPV